MTEKSTKRPFIGMHFTCCNVYSRIYLNRKNSAFMGWCPKCSRKVEVRVSPDGTKERFFTAG